MPHPYLILRLDGVMQAWGGHTFEDYRPAGLFPTRSGLLGLLGACAGIEWEDSANLQALADSVLFTVRTESRSPNCQAVCITDYHTVQNARKVDGSNNKNPIVSRREYWCDYISTVAIRETEQPAFSLRSIVKAIKKPVFTPALGRKSCPLSRPLFERWIEAENGVQALAGIEAKGVVYGIYTEEPEAASDNKLRVRDVPIYGPNRRFATRTVSVHGSRGEQRVSDGSLGPRE